MKFAANATIAAEDQPFPSAVELVLCRYVSLIDARTASALVLNAATPAELPAIMQS